MKNLGLFFMIILPFFCFGQVNESFLDGNFINNPFWTGTTSNFTVNSSFQLQSKAFTASTSFLVTPSEAFDDAVWECWVKLDLDPSVNNNMSIYIASDNDNISGGCNGYFIQIGESPDEVSLFLQEGIKKTRIINGINDRTKGNPVELRVKVTRNALGVFELFTKLSSENEFVSVGTTQNTVVKQSNYFGLMFRNTSTTGSDYYFDDIVVTGNKALDKDAPQWTSLKLELPSKLVLGFSECMDFSASAYIVNQDMGTPSSQIVSNDNKSITLTFDKNFEKRKVYDLQVSGLKDLAGNNLLETQRSIGIPESIGLDDLVFNEVMFENPLNSLEYVEVYNRSDKLLDISGLIFTSRKTDGTLNSGTKIPDKTLLIPNGYLALTSAADSIRNYHRCPTESNIIEIGWSSLNNESSTLVLANAAKDTIYDELTYDVKWHHALVKNPKGVALERIHPELPTQSRDSWHSAASETNYGTPGHKNSQYRDIDSEPNQEKSVWLEPEAFSPDNDGVDDVCLIKYKTDANGYIANALILNPAGVQVYRLATNLLLSTEGFLTWDGRTDSGKNVNVGIYVLYFEMFNSENGKRIQKKLPIVVSCR